MVDRAFVSQLGEIIDVELIRGCFDKSYEDAITSAVRILEECPYPYFLITIPLLFMCLPLNGLPSSLDQAEVDENIEGQVT
jgi:hypothetical protein